VRNAGATFHVLGLNLAHEFRHARGAARTFEPALSALEAGFMNGHAARVVATVFKALQTLNQDGDDVSIGNCTNNAAHKPILLSECGGILCFS
jgi:hypothetical protein